MGPILGFFTGLFSLGASAGLAIKEQSEIDRKNREYVQNRYSYAVQSGYDFHWGRLNAAYDMDKVIGEVMADYPLITRYNAIDVARAAVAKKMMETETEYKYKPEEKCSFFDLDKYAKEEFKR